MYIPYRIAPFAVVEAGSIEKWFRQLTVVSNAAHEPNSSFLLSWSIADKVSPAYDVYHIGAEYRVWMHPCSVR